MWYYLVKLTISALIIVAVSEIAERHSGFAALLASLPLTSLLAMVWMHVEGVKLTQIAELSSSVFWLVLPSLVLFLLLPVLIKYGLAFWPSLGWSCLATIVCYGVMVLILRRFGIVI